jgi:hypothetical protein
MRLCVCEGGGEVKRLVHKPKLGLGLSMYKQILRLDFSVK